MKAFVSSTFADLKEHRAHVIRCLRQAGIQVDPMEDWTADSQEPEVFCRARVDGCDLCVLLVARRRGNIPSGETRSITQIEYDHVVKSGIHVLVFMLDDEALWHRDHDDLDRDRGIVCWRQNLCENHVVKFFQHDPQSIDVAPAISRWLANRSATPKVEALPFTVEWYVFAPFCPGIPSVIETLLPAFQLDESTPDMSKFSFSQLPKTSLTWFPFGGAVWTISYETTFSDLGEFALRRRQLYRAILKGDHPVRQMTKHILSGIAHENAYVIPYQQPIGYALSLCFITQHAWPEVCVSNGLQILACPNVLMGDRWTGGAGGDEMGELIADRENDYLVNGVTGADLKEFSLPHVLRGYACWAGVSAYIEPNCRAELARLCVAYEEHLQSLWWRLHSYESLLDGSATNTVVRERVKGINRFMNRILRVGPTDVTALRLFKEAALTTSRIETVWNTFKNTLQNTT